MENYKNKFTCKKTDINSDQFSVKKSTIKCSHCGKVFASSYKFCPNCGNNLSNTNSKKENHVFNMVRLGDGKYKIISLNRKDLLSIKIPSCVSVIGEYAFSGAKMMEVQLNEGLVIIEKGAFLNCKYLNKINFPSTLKVIDDVTFKDCRSLNVTLPSNLTFKGEDVLANTQPEIRQNELIKSLSYLYDFQRIDKNKFKLIRVRDETMTKCCIPDFITEIDENAFYYCRNLKEIRIPNNIKNLDLVCLKDLEKLEDLYISSSVESIELSFPARQLHLKNIYIDQNNEHYDSRNNCNCIIDSLTNELVLAAENFKIPEEVSVIDLDKFCEITKDIDFFVHKSVKLVDNLSSQIRRHINSITVEEGNKVYISQKEINSLIERESKTLIMGCKNTIIPSGVENIGKDAFYDCVSPLSIYFPSSIKNIDKYAFFFSKNRLDRIEVSKDNKDFYSVDLSNTLVSRKGDILILGCKNSIITPNIKKLGHLCFCRIEFNNNRVLIPFLLDREIDSIIEDYEFSHIDYSTIFKL